LTLTLVPAAPRHPVTSRRLSPVSLLPQLQAQLRLTAQEAQAIHPVLSLLKAPVHPCMTAATLLRQELMIQALQPQIAAHPSL